MSLKSDWKKSVKALGKTGVDTDQAFTLDFEEQLDKYEKALKAWRKIEAGDPEEKEAKAQREGEKTLMAVQKTIKSYLLVLNQAGRFTTPRQQSGATYTKEWLEALEDNLQSVYKKEFA